MMRMSALLHGAPFRAVIIHGRRLTTFTKRLFTAWGGKPREPEPIRSFSVPSGFSSARPPLTLALAAIGLVACSTVAVGTLLTSASSQADSPAVVALELSKTGSLAYDDAETQVPVPAEEEPAAPAAPPVRLSDAPAAAGPAPPAPIPLPTAATAETARATAPARRPPIPPEQSYAGVWATTEKACSPQLKRDGPLPALISSEGAWAGETTCSFKSSKRVGNTWTFAAICSDTRRRWKADVRVSVAGNRLTWSSQRGSQKYVRCRQGLLEAQGAQAVQLARLGD